MILVMILVVMNEDLFQLLISSSISCLLCFSADNYCLLKVFVDCPF